MLVRVANKSDAEVMVELFDEFYNHEWFEMYKASRFREFADTQRANKQSVKKFKKWLKNIEKLKDEQVYVLEVDGKMVGFIVGFIRDKDSPWKVRGHVDDLFIIKDYRGKGGGRKLIHALLKWFKERGAKYSTLGVDIINPKAIKFYEEFGYKKTNYKMIKKL